MSTVSQAFHFGAFSLYPASRLLLEDGQPVRLGARALDLLIVLVEQSGEVIPKEELFRRVWPNTIVEETSLRVHIAALRKALGGSEARYIANVPGKGYSFAGELERRDAVSPGAPCTPTRTARHNLPVRLTKMVGRSASSAGISTLLLTKRFVTITGEGGVGKTTLALAVAEENLGEYVDGTTFVDLAACAADSELVCTVGRALGLPLPPNSTVDSLCDVLKGQRYLLVVDNCEHLVSAAADLISDLLRRLPTLRILATSREPLKADGEHVHRLETLPVPPENQPLAVDQALGYEAVQLLVERACAAADGFVLDADNVSHAAELCRRLDGVPLAIELAAARVSFFGLEGLLGRLHDRLSILTSGHRTVMPRHQTLRALYDWSYDLLDEHAKHAFRRLAVFPAEFSLDAGLALMPGEDRAAALSAFLELISKSLVAANCGNARRTYRLLDTARVYAHEKLQADPGPAGLEDARRCHAVWLTQTLHEAGKEWTVADRRAWVGRFAVYADDVRAALEWVAKADAEAPLYGELAAAAYLLLQELSQIEAHRQHLQAALDGMKGLTNRNRDLERHLTVLLGEAISHCKPHWEHLEKWLEEAKETFDTPQLDDSVLYCESVAYLAHGEYRQMLKSSERLEVTAEATRNFGAVVTSRRLQAQARHFLGQHAIAKHLAEGVLQHSNLYMRKVGTFDTMDKRVSMGILLARTAWLQGDSKEAWRVLSSTADLAAKEYEFCRCQYFALAAVPIALWDHNLAAARESMRFLKQLTERPQLSEYWKEWFQAFTDILDDVRPRYGLHSVKLLDLIGTIDPLYDDERMLQRALSGVGGWSAPEVLRNHAERIRAANPSEAESLLLKSLSLARHQRATRWELRTALSLAALSQQEGRLLITEQAILTPLAKLVPAGDDRDEFAATVQVQELARLRTQLTG